MASQKKIRNFSVRNNQTRPKSSSPRYWTVSAGETVVPDDRKEEVNNWRSPELKRDTYASKLNGKKDGWRNTEVRDKSNNGDEQFSIDDYSNLNIIVTPYGDHRMKQDWVLWTHDISSEDWSIRSYKRLLNICTVEDYWIMFNNIKSLIDDEMFFFMKEGYVPIWEDKKNINGGGWTFMYNKGHQIIKYWREITILAFCSLLSTERDNIVGISSSPKFRNVVLRIWTKNPNTTKNSDEFESIREYTDIDMNFSKANYTPNKTAKK